MLEFLSLEIIISLIYLFYLVFVVKPYGSHLFRLLHNRLLLTSLLRIFSLCHSFILYTIFFKLSITSGVCITNLFTYYYYSILVGEMNPKLLSEYYSSWCNMTWILIQFWDLHHKNILYIISEQVYNFIFDLCCKFCQWVGTCLIKCLIERVCRSCGDSSSEFF